MDCNNSSSARRMITLGQTWNRYEGFSHHVQNLFPNVPVHARSTRAIACPTFVYGLACDYVVFAEVFSHHVQNLFPNVLVDTRSKRAIACPTFVYGLACDYIVFAKGFNHHVQNLFPNVFALAMRCVRSRALHLCTAWHAITLYLLRFSVTMSRIYSPMCLSKYAPEVC